jgi:hypothetical protein
MAFNSIMLFQRLTENGFTIVGADGPDEDPGAQAMLKTDSVQADNIHDFIKKGEELSMRKTILLMIAVIFMLATAACGNSSGNGGQPDTSGPAVEQNADGAAGAGQGGNDDSYVPFVPENPVLMPLREGEVEIPLSDRLPVFGQDIGTEDENGAVTYSGGTINKSLFPMPIVLEEGEKIIVTVVGQFHSSKDSSIRVYLSNAASENVSKYMHTHENTGSDIFSTSFELEAAGTATHIMLASSSYNTYFDHFTLHHLTIGGDIDVQQMISDLTEQYNSEEWYINLLNKAQLNLGNNYRLKKVIDKAKAGEEITFATIGGSITESGGAKKYTDGYAYQTYEKLKREFGAGDGSNIKFINAGVGGTPSTFGIMRYERDIVDNTTDPDGLPDIVIVEYAVNDGGEPTNHAAYESLVKNILLQPNDPVVILLFSVFPSGYTLQNELKKVGERYDLMMVSIKDSAYPHIGPGRKWTQEEFFHDIYHPTSLGHGVMADAVFHAIKTAYEMPTSPQDINLDVPPAYSTAYVGIKTIFKDSYDESINLSLGSFAEDDPNAYRSLAIGKVYDKNFHHISGTESLTFTIKSKNLLLAYRAVNDPSFGEIEVYVDGKKVKTINGNTGGWGQSVTDVIFAENTAEVHTIEIKMAPGSEHKKFTITCMGYTE